MVDFQLDLTVASFEQGVALIDYGVGSDFVPLRPTAWLDLGRQWQDQLPWMRERRAYDQRLQCHVDSDWFRVAAKRLRAISDVANADALVAVSYRDNVLVFALAGQKLAMPATGNPWLEPYHCESYGLRLLSKRTPSNGVHIRVWKNQLVIGNLHLPLIENPATGHNSGQASRVLFQRDTAAADRAQDI